MTKKMWCGVCELSEKFPELFDWLDDTLRTQNAFWDSFYGHLSPDQLDLPFKVAPSFNGFHFALLVKLIRPDKFIKALAKLIVA
jgi:hypothetical protein